MVHQSDTLEKSIDFTNIPGTSLKVSRVALGTWAIGGWMWGGTDEAESVSTILAALDHGINVIYTGARLLIDGTNNLRSVELQARAWHPAAHRDPAQQLGGR